VATNKVGSAEAIGRVRVSGTVTDLVYAATFHITSNINQAIVADIADYYTL
jgi:hypothetical protein